MWLKVGDQNHVLQANENEAWRNFVKAVEKVATKFDVDPVKDVILCFSGTYDTPNFRLAIDPGYKSNRAEKRKPLCYGSIRESLDELYKTQTFPGLEADDVMGIMATKPKADYIVVSQDKDMKTLPSTIWTGKELLRISEEEANYWHMYQTLTGDAVDGYKGCPGMGPVSAEKLLQSKELWEDGMFLPHRAWYAVAEAYQKKQLTQADALRNARLARILRWSDWDMDKKEPILWTPLYS